MLHTARLGLVPLGAEHFEPLAAMYGDPEVIRFLEPAPLDREVTSGASDPMAISLTPFERQFVDFGEAIRTGRRPVSSGEDGYRAIEVVLAVYRSCREGRPVPIAVS